MDRTRIKTDFNKNYNYFELGHNNIINELDSGSHDCAIKLWDGNDGSLIIE